MADPHGRDATIGVRPLNAEDLEAVIDGIASRPADLYRERLQDQSRGGYRWFIAWLDDQAAGYVGEGLPGDRATVEMCEARLRDGSRSVRGGAYRRRGAGDALMSTVEGAALEAQMTGVILETGTTQDYAPARRLY